MASSPTGGLFLLGASGESDGCLFGRQLQDSDPIASLVFLRVTGRHKIGCFQGLKVIKSFALFEWL